MTNAAGGTKSDAVYRRIRADILSAQLVPGQRLKFPDMVAEYGVSVGVLREALNQLVAERLVSVQPNRGFQVVTLSVEDLLELTEARVELESLVLRLSVGKGDTAWEARVIAAHHVLERTPVNADDDRPGRVSSDWSRVHADFHQALLEGCANVRLLATAMQLREEAELYQHWAVSRGGLRPEQFAGEHRQLRDAAVARDGERAADLLRTHLVHTADAVLDGRPTAAAAASAGT